MDKLKVKRCAEELQALLAKYSGMDQDARLLGESLGPLLAKATSGALDKPVPFAQVPGDYFFSERELSRYTDLANAYSTFVFAVSNGDSPQVKEALQAIHRMRK